MYPEEFDYRQVFDEQQMLRETVRDWTNAELKPLAAQIDRDHKIPESVIQGLKDFEFALRRDLGAEIERLFLSGSDDVPPEYREMVEKYYESLSKGQN